MSGSRIKQKDWVLSGEAFDRFLYWLDPDRNFAGEKYELIRKKVCFFFVTRGFVDAEDQVDETINRMARSVYEDKPIRVKPETFALGIAKNVLLEWYDKPDNKKRAPLDGQAIEDIFAVDPWKDEPEDDGLEERIKCWKECLEKLNEDEREKVIAYHRGIKQGEAKKIREKLAQRLGIKITKLRKDVMNIKKRLMPCVKGCVGTSGAE